MSVSEPAHTHSLTLKFEGSCSRSLTASKNFASRSRSLTLTIFFDFFGTLNSSLKGLTYLERTATLWVGSEVVGSYVELVPSLEQERPVVGVLFDLLLAGLEAEIS